MTTSIKTHELIRILQLMAARLRESPFDIDNKEATADSFDVAASGFQRMLGEGSVVKELVFSAEAMAGVSRY